MNKKYILFVVLPFVAWSCKTQSVLRQVEEHLHKDGAHITAIPRFSPLYDMPLVPLIVKKENKSNADRIPFYNDSDGLIGVDIYRYAPSKPFSYGFYLDAVRHQFTLNDLNHPTFTTRELQLKPYAHYKLGHVSSRWHWDFNAGGSMIYAFGRSVSYYYNGSAQNSNNTLVLNPVKFEIFAGTGLTFDLLERDKHEKGIFERRKIKLLTANFQWNIPIPLLNHSNFFKNSKGVTVPAPLNTYQLYLAKGSYFTFTLGTRVDLFKYQYYEDKNIRKNFAAGVGIDNEPLTHAFLLPNYLKTPSKDHFGGFHVDMTVASPTVPLAYQMEGKSFQHEFRAGLKYAIGYNYHFGSNYKQDTFVEGKQERAKKDFWVGAQITKRNFVPHNEQTQQYEVTSLGATTGGRINIYRQIYGGLGLDMDYNRSQKLDASNKATTIDFVPKWTIAPVLSLGWRNIISLKVKYRNPLYGAMMNKPHFLNQLEYWVSMGF